MNNYPDNSGIHLILVKEARIDIAIRRAKRKSRDEKQVPLCSIVENVQRRTRVFENERLLRDVDYLMRFLFLGVGLSYRVG